MQLTSFSSSEARENTRRYHLWTDMENVGRNFVSDAARVYSSPSRINGKSALILGGVLAVGGIIYIYDQEIYDAFDRSRDATLYKPIRNLGEDLERLGFMGTTNKFFVGGLAASYIVRWDKAVSLFSDILQAHWTAGGFKNIANLTAGRARPFEDKGPRSFKFDEGTSLPSGHALNIIQMATVFSHHIDFWPFSVAAYTVAGAVSLERITSGNHWPSDVYFAVVGGYFVSKEILRFNDNRRLTIQPIAGSSNNSYGLRLSLGL